MTARWTHLVEEVNRRDAAWGSNSKTVSSEIREPALRIFQKTRAEEALRIKSAI